MKNIKKRFVVTILSAGCLVSALNAANAETPATVLSITPHEGRPAFDHKTVDLTPIFSGLEIDCASGNLRFDSFMQSVVSPDGKPPAVSSLPNEVRLALSDRRGEKVHVTDGGEYRTIILPMRSASYKGLRLSVINRWVGKRNGYAGLSLYFVDSVKTVQRVLGSIASRDEAHDQTQPELFTSVKTHGAVLSCDFSD